MIGQNRILMNLYCNQKGYSQPFLALAPILSLDGHVIWVLVRTMTVEKNSPAVVEIC